MPKQSDTFVILAVLAAVIGVFVMSSDTATLVIAVALAAVFGGLVGVRVRWSRGAGEAEADGDDTEHPTAGESELAEAGPRVMPETDEAEGDGEGGAAAAGAARAGSPATGDEPADADRERFHLAGRLVDTMCEGVTFKNTEGTYLYANTVFGQMFGVRPSEIIGKRDSDIFGYLTATALAETDEVVSQDGQISATVEIPVEVGSRFYEITKAMVGDGESSLEGIVAVWRDVTDTTIELNRREKAMSETIAAFTKSIQFRDPYLADHAVRLARLATAVADTLGLDESARTTVELAAYLSQLGKLGVDADLLTMQRRLTDEEIKEVQRHVHHTARLLRDLDFGLPVAATLFQMNERLDGEGYPKGVRGDEIAMPARILGACDVFCARTAPRSYRVAIPPETAIGILQQNLHRYDETVIDALRQIVASPEAEKLLA